MSNNTTQLNIDTPVRTQDLVLSHLEAASVHRSQGDKHRAIAELEGALTSARANPYEVEFPTRVRLASTLAEDYLSTGALPAASQMLAFEVAFVEKVSAIIHATGTIDQKRAASAGSMQLSDLAIQIGLIGKPAPEIKVEDWVHGSPASLEDLRGQVVLLEFWATWCKPCQEMFPKLKALYDEYHSQGLAIISLTRRYFSFGGTDEAKVSEIGLIKKAVDDHSVEYRAGILDGIEGQAAYGATGLPTIALIDRKGIVRYAGSPTRDDEGFKSALNAALAESI